MPSVEKMINKGDFDGIANKFKASIFNGRVKIMETLMEVGNPNAKDTLN